MSRNRKFMENVLSLVADALEIPCETIISRCSRADVVDARWIVVNALHNAGIYTMTIAEFIGVSPRYVQYIITDFEDRINCNKPLRKRYEMITNKLRNNLEIIAL